MKFLQEQGISAARIILFGESLGTGVATQLAADPETAPLAVILDSPFTSAADVARTTVLVPAGRLADEGPVPVT